MSTRVRSFFPLALAAVGPGALRRRLLYRGFGALLILLPMVALLGGCIFGPEAAGKIEQVPDVEVSLPVEGVVTDSEEFTGRILATDFVEVRAQATGYLEKINFVEGVEVKKDDVLFEIDPRTYQAEYESAAANLVQAQTHHKRLRTDYDRAKVASAREAMSQEDYDRVAGDYMEAEAAVGVAKAKKDSAKLNLDFCKVRSPLNGLVSRRSVDPGNMVLANTTVLTNIVSLDPIYVYFDVDERTTLKIRRLIFEGKIKSIREAPMKVSVGLSDEKDFPHEGFINFVDNRLDNGTGTLQVRGRLSNPLPTSERPIRLFSPGMFVRVQLPIGDLHPAVLVAEKALGTDQGQKFLYVVEKEKSNLNVVSVGDKDDKANNSAEEEKKEEDKFVARYRKVEVGSLVNGRRVIDKGLALGERIVVRGLQRVQADKPVKPKEVPMPKGTGQDKPPMTVGLPPPSAKGAPAPPPTSRK